MFTLLENRQQRFSRDLDLPPNSLVRQMVGVFFQSKKGSHQKGVGPNAANLTEKHVLSHLYVFRVEAVVMPPGTYVCCFCDDSPSRDFSFDIPAYPG